MFTPGQQPVVAACVPEVMCDITPPYVRGDSLACEEEVPECLHATQVRTTLPGLYITGG